MFAIDELRERLFRRGPQAIRAQKERPGFRVAAATDHRVHRWYEFQQAETVQEWHRAVVLQEVWSTFAGDDAAELPVPDLAELFAATITGRAPQSLGERPSRDWEEALRRFGRCLEGCPPVAWPSAIEDAMISASVGLVNDVVEVVWNHDGLFIHRTNSRKPIMVDVPSPCGSWVLDARAWQPARDLLALVQNSGELRRPRQRRPDHWRGHRIQGTVKPFESLAVEWWRSRVRFIVNVPAHLCEAPWSNEYVHWPEAEVFVELSAGDTVPSELPLSGFVTSCAQLALHPIVGPGGDGGFTVCVGEGPRQTALHLQDSRRSAGAIAAAQLLAARAALIYGTSAQGAGEQQLFHSYLGPRIHAWIPAAEALLLAKQRGLEVVPWQR